MLYSPVHAVIGLITVMFGVVSVGMNSVKFARNDWKVRHFGVLDYSNQLITANSLQFRPI